MCGRGYSRLYGARNSTKLQILSSLLGESSLYLIHSLLWQLPGGCSFHTCHPLFDHSLKQLICNFRAEFESSAVITVNLEQ